DLSRSRVYEEQIALGVGDGLVRQRSVEALQRCDTCACGIVNLLRTAEIGDAVTDFRDFTRTLRKITGQYRSAVGRNLVQRSDGRSDRQRRPGRPTEDSAPLPAFHKTLHECRRVAEKRA